MKYKKGDLLEYKWYPKNYRKVKSIMTFNGVEGYEVVGIQRKDFNKEGEIKIFFSKYYLEKEYILIKRASNKIRRIE